MFHLKAVGMTVVFAAVASAQIAGLCNTGQTHVTIEGCTGQLVPPNPVGGGPDRDGNWQLAYPYPTYLANINSPCELTNAFPPAFVDTPNAEWLPNSGSTASEWITPPDGEGTFPPGWYVYRTRFHIPAVLPNGIVPTALTIIGRLTSDNATYGIYLQSPVHSSNCSLVAGQFFPINPSAPELSDFQQWWPFRFRNELGIAAGQDAFLYFTVQNYGDVSSATGFRLEFTSSGFY